MTPHSQLVMQKQNTALFVCSLALSFLGGSRLAADTPWVILSQHRDHQLSVYSIAADGETLDLVRSVALDGGPGAMCIDATGTRLYVALKQSKSIAAFRITDAAELIPLGQSIVGAAPSFLALHPTGRFLYSSYYADGQAAVHRLDTDGKLSTSPIQVLKTDERAHCIAVTADGTHAFVPHTRPNLISQFIVDANTGRLKPNAPPKLTRQPDSGPRHLSMHPGGRFAYGSDEQGSSITAYRIDSSTGQLSVIETKSTLPASGFAERNSTSDIEVHPSGQFVYVANRGHNTLASYRIDAASGRLQAIERTPTEPLTRSFNLSPAGDYLIAAGQNSGRVRIFRIDSSGQLILTGTQTLGSGTWWVQTVPRITDRAHSSN